MEDVKKIVCKFLLWGKISFVENHDPSTTLVDNPFDKLESKSCDSVFVGNHNFELFTSHCAFQYGFKPTTLIVESTSDVFDDLGFWVLRLHEVDLSFEVFSLFGA